MTEQGMKMEFISVQGEEVHIKGTADDRDVLCKIVSAAINSGDNLGTYIGIENEDVEATLRELQQDKTDGEIVISKDALRGIFGALSHVSALRISADVENLQSVYEDIDQIHASVFPRSEL